MTLSARVGRANIVQSIVVSGCKIQCPIQRAGRSPGHRGFAFGPFLIDPVRRLIWHDSRVVPVTDKTFDVLETLIEHRDRVLDKDEILKRVWPGTFVQENNLVRHVSMLRRALGQHPDQHDYIVTVTGVGYRFVAPVTEIDELAADLPTGVHHTPPEPSSVVEVVVSPPPLPEAAISSHLPEAVAAGAASGSLFSNSSGEPVPPESTDTAPLHQAAEGTRHAWTWGRSVGLAAGVAVVLAFAGGLLWRSGEASAHRSLRQVTYGPDVQLGPTWAPDGRALAFSSNRSGDFEIWVQSLDQPDPIRITHSAGPDWKPSWSPDGKLIAFRSERDQGGLYVVSPRGEGLRRVSTFGYSPIWSPDGSLLLFDSARVDRIRPQHYVVGLDGSPPRLARPEMTEDLVWTRAAWHPDGQLTIWGRTAKQGWTLIKAPISAGAAIRYDVPESVSSEVRKLDLSLTDFTWSPSGEFIYFEGRSQQVQNLWRVQVDRQTMHWKRLPERMTLSAGLDGDVALARDGSKLAFGSMSERTRLWSFPLHADTGRVSGPGDPLTPGGAGEYDAGASVDGTVLVYRTVRFGRQELWVRTMADGAQRLLIAGTEWIRTSPRVSADGTRVAYRLTRAGEPTEGGTDAVAILEANGGELILTAPGARSLTPDDWSKDGTTILGTCWDGTTIRGSVCTIAAQPNSEAKVLVSDPNRAYFSAHYSPNQRWLSVVEREFPRVRDWKGSITVMPVGGGPRIRVTDGKWNDEKPRWSADGRAIYFVSNRSGFLNVWGRRFDPESGQPQGDVFKVTDLDDLHRFLPIDMAQVEISVAGPNIIVPVTELSGTIWSLEGIDR